MVTADKQKQIEEIYNQALALEKSGNFTDAARFYIQLLALDKKDCVGAAVRLAAMGQGGVPEIAPPAYIATLFDQYADVFDMILVDKLKYHVPDLLFAAVNKYYPGRIFKKLLDLGCGTGLVGEVFAEHSLYKSGVDLSQNMIEIAHEREIYNKLFVGDILLFLQKAAAKKTDKIIWDGIFAADVLPYIGALKQFFALTANVLEKGGIFGFSSENLEKTVLAAPQTADKKSFAVGPHQRFAHNQSYIESSLAAAGLKSVLCNDIIVRQEQNQPVFGQLFLAEKQ